MAAAAPGILQDIDDARNIAIQIPWGYDYSLDINAFENFKSNFLQIQSKISSIDNATLLNHAPELLLYEKFRIHDYVVIQNVLYDTNISSTAPPLPPSIALSDNDITRKIIEAKAEVYGRIVKNNCHISEYKKYFDHDMCDLMINIINIKVKTLNVGNEWAKSNQEHDCPHIYKIFEKMVVLELMIQGGNIIMLQECSPEFLFLIKKFWTTFHCYELCCYNPIGSGQNKYNVILLDTILFTNTHTIRIDPFEEYDMISQPGTKANKGMKMECELNGKKLYIRNVHLARKQHFAVPDFYELFTKAIETGLHIIGGDFNLRYPHSSSSIKTDSIDVVFYNKDIFDGTSFKPFCDVFNQKYGQPPYQLPPIFYPNLKNLTQNSTYKSTSLAHNKNDGIFFYKLPVPPPPAPPAPAAASTPSGKYTPGALGKLKQQPPIPGGSLNKKISYENKYNKYLEKINML
jgi:hypothetical protein